MAFRADDVQTAGLQHAVMRFVGGALEVLVEGLVLFARGKDFVGHIFCVPCRGFNDFLVIAVLTHGAAGEELRVAAQQNVRAAASHVGGNGDGTPVACLRDDFSFLGVVLCVQHLMLDAAALKHGGEHFARFNRDRADQHGLTVGVHLRNRVHNGVELRLLRLVDHVVQVLADVGLVGGNLHDVQRVDVLELVLFRLRRTRHAGELVVHAEIVLEGDGRQCAAFALNGHMLLGFNRLMQTLGVAAANHQAAREFINDDDLIVLYHVIHVALHQEVGAQGAADVVVQLGIFRVVDVGDAERGFDALGALVGQADGLFLLFNLEVNVALERADDRVHSRVEVGRFVARAGDNQRGARFVNQDGVHFVDDGEVVAALHQLALADDHVVAQVVEAQLVVRAVGDVAGIGGAALGAVQIVDNQADAQPHEAVDFAHPFAVAARQIVVDGHDVHALAGQRVQVRGQGGHQRFALAGLHLGDAPLMQHQTAHHLYAIRAHSQHAGVGFADGGERFGQNVIFGFAILQARAEFIRLGAQLLIRQRLVFIFKGFHGVDRLLQLFDLRVIAAAQQFFDPIEHKVLLSI